jgi:polyhydroxyalkanoate synthesis regulator phasin
MADRAESLGAVRELVERLMLAGIGAVALTRERAEELADELAERGNLSRTEARQAVDEVAGRWRNDASRLGERAGASLSTAFREMGLVTRREYEELELRLAQVEHRLRLVESGAETQIRPAGTDPRRP